MSRSTIPGSSGFALALRFAARELRGGLSRFFVFIGCIGLGVMAIAAVGSLAAALANGLDRQGRVILGGDLAFLLSMREATADEHAFLAAQGEVSSVVTMRAMVRANAGRAALVELRAVDNGYPLYGTVLLDPRRPLAEVIGERDGVFGAAAAPELLTQLGLAVPARIALGSAVIEVRAVLVSEPDKLAGGIGFGPRLVVAEAALRRSDLLQPGSVVRWHYRVRLPNPNAGDGAVERVAAAAHATLPDAGWEIRSRAHASPALERNLERFAQYLTLVGLGALLIGGVGVANAIRWHLNQRQEAIATLKVLGASGPRVFTIYITQVLAIALVGALPGVTVGIALPFLLARGLLTVLPLPIAPVLDRASLGFPLLCGLLTAVAFALWPLGRAHDVSATVLFRAEVATERRRLRPAYIVATVVSACALAALVIAHAYDRRIAFIFIAGAVAALVLLRLFAALVMSAAARLPRSQLPVVRLAIANMHRPGALTPSMILSLGFGLALLVLVITIDSNLRHHFLAALPEHAPSLYFVDIPQTQLERFEALVHARAPAAALERVPMLRGRILAVNGVAVDRISPPPDVAWALRGDRGITYADKVPAGSRLVEGDWWQHGAGDVAPLVSFEKRVADGLGLRVGDSVTVNVLGRNLTATVANLRSVDWQSLGINFVMVFSPAALRGAPHTYLATLTFPAAAPESEAALVRSVAEDFPAIATLRVRDALEAVAEIVLQLVVAIRVASALTIVVAVLVLGGALAAGQRQRVYDAVILKTLGATRMRLLSAHALEYGALAVLSGVFGLATGWTAAALVLTRLMHLSFSWPALSSLSAVAGAIIVTVVLGLLATFKALGAKPAAVLRYL